MTSGSGPGRLEIRLLGPVEALLDGAPVASGGARPRALLTVLALSAGTAVSTERLIDTVWDGAPPAGAANSVQVYVSRMRKTLQPEGAPPVLRSSPGGYLLDIPPDAVDVLRFERLAATGHDRLGAGQPEEALPILTEALALWRGPALSDLDGPASHGLVERLDARHLAVRMDHIDARIALGEHTTAVPELQEMVRQHPLNEGLVARLMTALYVSGRQGDALAAYATAARQLADELGVDPGPHLRLVHGEVLRQSLKIPAAAQTAAAQPAPPAAITPDEPDQTAQRTRTLEAMLRPRGDLVGRSVELARALQLLEEPSVRIVSLLGPGGMGKTRLAMAIAEALNSAAAQAITPDAPPERAMPRAVVVPLSTVTEDGELLASIAQVVGAVPEWAGQAVFDVVVRGLEGRRTVLVLDNLEQLIDSDGVLDDILILLDRLPLLTLLCTTRTSLRLSQEHQISLGPLSVPDIDEFDVDAVRASDAVQLFCDRAAAVLPGFTVTDDNARAVAEVCRLLDGQPLALELAAARSRVLKPEDMVLRTGRLLQLLTGGGRDLPTRHRSVRAALDWSAQLLDATEANVFAQLSVFSGGWTVDAAEAVCVADEDVFEVLARLVDKSLVVATGDGRLSMLETVREYADERLEVGGHDPIEVIALRNRHARYYAELAEELGPRCRTAPGATTRARLDAEGGNLSAALEHSAAEDDGLMLGRLTVGLLDYWFFSCRISQARRWLHIAEAAPLPHDLRARLLLSAGNIAFVEGDLARAVPAFRGALQTARALGDHVLIARALTARAVAARHIGRMDDALVFIDEAWLRARDSDVDPDEATLLQGMLPQVENERGEILDGLGRPEEARPHFEAYRQHGIAEGDRSGVAWASMNLALVELAEGRDESAKGYAAAALTAADDGGYAPVRGDARFVAGLVALADSQPQRAIPLLADAVRLHHSAGQLLTVPDTISLLGVALLNAGRVPEAARMLAAGGAWRGSHGLAVIGRLAQQVIAAAEEQLALLPPTPQIAADAARGLATPYGSIESLDLPAEDDDQPPVLRLVDVRQREGQLDDVERARLGTGQA